MRINNSLFSKYVEYLLVLIAITLLINLFIYINISSNHEYTYKFRNIYNSKNIAIVSMIKDCKNIDQWLDYHRSMGISKFYIRLEDSISSLHNYLKLQQDVYIQLGESSGYDEYNMIVKRQQLWVIEALILANRDNIGWLIHIDADELLHGDLNTIRKLPKEIEQFYMFNYEALYYDVPSNDDTCFQAASFVNCTNGGCVSYSNGKAGARPTKDMTFYGPHRFIDYSLYKQGVIDEYLVLNLSVRHYESCDYNSFVSKFKNLAKNPNLTKVQFIYYNESIKAASSHNNEALKCIYRKYRTIIGKDHDCASYF